MWTIKNLNSEQAYMHQASLNLDIAVSDTQEFSVKEIFLKVKNITVIKNFVGYQKG